MTKKQFLVLSISIKKYLKRAIMLFEVFEKNCIESKDKIALFTKGRSYTYKELLEYTNTLASNIEYIGSSEITPIGLAFPNNVEFIALIFANISFKRPSILFGASLKAQEIAYHVKNLGVRIMLASPLLRHILEEAGGTKLEYFTSTIDYWSFDVDYKPIFREGDFICQFTSGTNGIPKAVVRTEDAVWSQITDTSKRIGLTKDDNVLNIPPMHHAYGLIGGVLMALSQGAALALNNGFMPADVIDIIQKNKISILFAVPFMYNILNQYFKNMDPQKQQLVNLSSLRLCLSGGARMPEEIAKEFYNNFKKQVCQNYGSTETGVMCINLDPESRFESVGLPFGDRQMQAFDESGNQLPPDSIGEIWFKSKATARAYIYPEELNSAMFSKGWYKTGDLGKVDKDGYVYLTGRKYSMINVAGLKVDPVEVENIILKLNGIIETVVIGIPHEMSGQVVKAFVVASDGIKEIDIINHCRKELADFKVPRVICLIDKLPKTETGKVLKKYLIK